MYRDIAVAADFIPDYSVEWLGIPALRPKDSKPKKAKKGKKVKK